MTLTDEKLRILRRSAEEHRAAGLLVHIDPKVMLALLDMVEERDAELAIYKPTPKVGIGGTV